MSPNLSRSRNFGEKSKFLGFGFSPVRVQGHANASHTTLCTIECSIHRYQKSPDCPTLLGEKCQNPSFRILQIAGFCETFSLHALKSNLAEGWYSALSTRVHGLSRSYNGLANEFRASVLFHIQFWSENHEFFGVPFLLAPSAAARHPCSPQSTMPMVPLILYDNNVD